MKFTLFFLLALAATMQAQPELPAGPVPPNARAAEISVERGSSVEISLETDRRTTRQLRFVIRQSPAHGQLSEVRNTDAQTATVTYVHGGDPYSKTDQFRFAAGTQGLGYSAPATVTIHITNPPARLKAPRELNLGEVLQGSPASVKLTLQNSGGETLEGIISVPAPWLVKPSGTYKIEPGGSAGFEVHLLNAAAGNFDGIMRYSSHPGVRTPLSAQVIDPFIVDPPTLENDGWTENKTAEISVTNSTSQNQEFIITTPEGIESPAALSVPPKNTATLTFIITDPIRARSGTAITLSSTLRTLTIPVAPPDPTPDSSQESSSKQQPLTSPGAVQIARSPSPQPVPPSPDTHPASTPPPPPPTKEIRQEESNLALFQELGLTPQPNPAASEIQITKLKPTSVTFTWQAQPPLQAGDYQINALMLQRDDEGELRPRWQQIPINPRSGKSGKVSVTINQLLPESIYHFRLTSDRFTPESETPFSPAFVPPILTPEKGVSAPIIIVICLLAAVVIAGIFWGLRQNTVDDS